MSDLMKAFKTALLQAGPGLVAQIQGDNQSAQAFYKAADNRAAAQKKAMDEQFSQGMKLRQMALNIQEAKDSQVLREHRMERDAELIRLKKIKAMQGKPDDTKLQQLRDTFSTKTNNPTAFDPTRRDNAIIDMITGEPVEEVYTGVQNRFNKKRGDTLTKELNKEWERQSPVKSVLNALDVADDILTKGVDAVSKSESLFEATKMGFTGWAREKSHAFRSKSSFFEMDAVDQLFDNFRGNTTQIIANQVKSFTGAQATDAERDFLLQMAPDPSVTPSLNRVRITNLRKMLQFLDKRNAAIEARIGKNIQNVSAEMAPGQDLFTFAKENNLVIPTEDASSLPKHTQISVDEQARLNRINQNTTEIEEAYRELELLNMQEE